MVVLRMLAGALGALIATLVLLVQFEKIERALDVAKQHHSMRHASSVHASRVPRHA